VQSVRKPASAVRRVSDRIWARVKWIRDMKDELGKLFLIYGLGVAFLGAVILQPWLNPFYMFPDTIIAARIARNNDQCCGIYFGFVSNVGVLLWCITATACGCAAVVMKAAGAAPRQVAMMTAAAAFTGFLCVDDFFLLHEGVLPRLGIPQTLVIAGIAAMALGYVVAFQREIRQKYPVVFLFSITALVASLGIDILIKAQNVDVRIAEDSAKFLGIVGWAGFHILRALDAMRNAVGAAR
jgi:hypothetical protein